MYAQRHSSSSHHSYKAPGLHGLVKMNEKNKLKLWMNSYMLIDKLLACLNKPKKKIAFYDTHISVKSHFISFSRSAFQRFSYLPPKPQDISHTFFFHCIAHALYAATKHAKMTPVTELGFKCLFPLTIYKSFRSCSCCFSHLSSAGCAALMQFILEANGNVGTCQRKREKHS